MKKSKIKKLIKKELKKQCNMDIAGSVRGVIKCTDVREALAFLTSDEHECTYIVKGREEKY